MLDAMITSLCYIYDVGRYLYYEKMVKDGVEKTDKLVLRILVIIGRIDITLR